MSLCLYWAQYCPILFKALGASVGGSSNTPTAGVSAVCLVLSVKMPEALLQTDILNDAPLQGGGFDLFVAERFQTLWWPKQN
jgi:hypothetical protein